MENHHLENFGYSDFYREAAEELEEGFIPARVTGVNKNNYVVSDGMDEMPAELSGKFLFNADTAEDYPTVGDWVVMQKIDHTLAILHSILPRRTLLKRKTAGKKIDFQLIASNIDFGLIVQSADHLNLNLIDRYLVMLNENGIKPLIIISKTDLIPPEDLHDFRESLSGFRHEFLMVSNKTDDGTSPLTEILLPGKTYCLLGQSGVGKSSLLNRLMGTELLEVSDVREKDGKGRHTTVRRQLIRLENGSNFIDTPGMRELGNFQIDQGLDLTFEEFSAVASQCRFSNCTHLHEAGCAVIAAVEAGEIEGERYKNFIKLKKESDYYEMSYHEKRKKDKSFGKIVRNFKKVKGNNFN